MTIATAADLSDELRRFPLLEPDQLAGLAALQDRCAGPRELAGELVGRGWLTPYQINQIFRGHARDLLLGSHVLLERLGAGGMGQVFKARNRNLGRVVALKVIRPERVGEPEAVQRFRREIRAAAQMAHPNIVHAYDAEEIDGTHFIALELLPGADLARLLKQHGPLPVDQACGYVRQAALGLQHAHERGLIHRDVKPSNLFLTTQGVLKVLDLGLARLEQGPSHGQTFNTLPGQGTVLGTPDYIAPEQAQEAHLADIRSDLYSLGCTFYHLLTGRPPFPSTSLVEKITGHLYGVPAPVEELRPDVWPEVAAVVRKLMAKQPSYRFQTPGELAAALALILQQRLAHGAPPAGPPALPPAQVGAPADATATTPADLARLAGSPTEVAAVLPRRWRRRPRRWPLVLAGCAMLAGLLVLVLALRSRPRRPPAPPPSDPGELVLESEDPTARVIVEPEKAEEESRPLRAGAKLSLAPGEYRVRLAPGGPGGLRLSARRLALGSAGRKTVRVEGIPVGPWALVSRPATRQGLRSWTVATRGCRGQVERVAYSPDGSWLAFAGQDGTVRLAHTGSNPPAIRAFVGHAGAVRSLAWSADGATLASAGADQTVRLWRTTSGKVLRVLPWSAQALAWSRPDGSTLACAVGADVKLWDARKGEVLRTIPGETPQVGALAWSPDGDLLASGGSDGAVRLWNPRSGRLVRMHKGHTGPVYALAWSPDGKTLASGGGDWTVRLSKGDDGPPLLLTRHTGPVHALAWSPDGKALASGPRNNPTVQVHDTTSGALSLTVQLPLYATHGPHSLGWSADGKTWALASTYDPAVRLCDPSTGAPRSTLPGHAPIDLRGWSSDGEVFFCAGQTHEVYLVEASTGKVLHTVRNMPSWVGAVALTPDGKTLATENGGVIRLWDVETGGLLHRFDRTPNGPRFLAWSPDGKALAAAHHRFVRLWDPATPNPVHTLQEHTQEVAHLAWSPDGKVLASAGLDGDVRLWDAGSGDPLRQLPGHANGARCVAWSRDGKALAAGDGDGTVRLWEAAAGKVLAVLKGHQGAVRSLAWLPDRKALASSGEDGTVRLWDTVSGRPLSTSRGTRGGLLSPDGRLSASGAGPDTVRLWDSATGAPQGTAVLLRQGLLVLTAEGHCRSPANIGTELLYVAATEDGQETLSYGDFAQRYGWTNEPEKVRLAPR